MNHQFDYMEKHSRLTFIDHILILKPDCSVNISGVWSEVIHL